MNTPLRAFAEGDVWEYFVLGLRAMALREVHKALQGTRFFSVTRYQTAFYDLWNTELALDTAIMHLKHLQDYGVTYPLSGNTWCMGSQRDMKALTELLSEQLGAVVKQRGEL